MVASFRHGEVPAVSLALGFCPQQSAQRPDGDVCAPRRAQRGEGEEVHGSGSGVSGSECWKSKLIKILIKHPWLRPVSLPDRSRRAE